MAALGLLLTAPPAPAGEPVAAAAASPAPRTEVHTPAALARDFAVLRSALEEAHGGVYRYRSRAEIDRAFDATASRLTAPMDAIAFYRTVAPTVAAIQDGHTSLVLPEAVTTELRRSAPALPLQVHVSGGRLYVLRDLTATPASGADAIAGREIRSINGQPVARILARLRAVQPGDGAIDSARDHRLGAGLRFNLQHLLMYGASSTYQVEFTNGRPRTAILQGRPVVDLDQAWTERFPADRAPRPPAELGFDGDVAVLTLRSFEGPADLAETQPMPVFLKAAFQEMKTRGTRALVLDVRDNGGGQDELGRDLLSYLVDRPFPYYSGIYVSRLAFSFSEYAVPPGPIPDQFVTRDAGGRLRWAEHPNYGSHQPAPEHFSGPVYILMNGGSFSTTAEFLSLLHSRGRATFIGEESGGAYAGNSSGPTMTVTLPHTGLRLRVPLWRYELAVDASRPRDRGVRPDRPVVPRVEDILAGRDPAMSQALRLARQTASN